jgi:tetratricopeptide (TPR) repeat protein
MILLNRFFSLFSFFSFSLLSLSLVAQNCTSWENLPNKEDLIQSHVLYRGFIKDKNYAEAFPHWEKVYKEAPAADGQRPFHFSDGREIYLEKFKNESDKTLKDEYAQIIMRLYDEEMQCYQNIAFLAGRKAYDMFYTLNRPRKETFEALLLSLNTGGNNSEYILLAPFGHVLTSLFQKGQINAEEVVSIVEKLNEMADYNFENNKTYGQYYEDGKKAMIAAMKPVESQIFDCSYFKKNFLKKFYENPDSLTTVRGVYAKLMGNGCEKEDPELTELVEAFERLTKAENERLMAEYEAKNPAAAARRLYEEGKFKEAVEKFDEALSDEGLDDEQKAQIQFSKASVLGRKLNQYQSARAAAYEAARLKPNWGAPYMLIGDLYASSAKACSSDDMKQRFVIIAAIDKYAKAKSLDSEVAADAQKKINLYNNSLPDGGEAFMAGYKEGQQINTGCWVNETVSLRFK